MHQYPKLSDPVEIDNIDIGKDVLFGNGKKVGIRHIGIWNDAEYARHLYLLVDLKGDNKEWKQVVHWTDRGEYTAIVKKLVEGPFKSPPPYRDYPYGEDAARTRIGLRGYVNVDKVWCRQINPSAITYKFSNAESKSESNTVTKADTTHGKLLWDSDATLKVDNVKVISGTYANVDVANTILFASADHPVDALFGVRNGDAIWTGTMSRWYVNHHIIDSDVIDSRLEFDMIMGGADEIRIQLGNRAATGWILDNDYAFGGYEFVINREGKVWSRVEYCYGVDESGRKTSSYSIPKYLSLIEKFDPQMETHIDLWFETNNAKQQIRGRLNNIQMVWTQKDWLVKPAEIPKGRIDSKELETLYLGPKMHWSIQRVRSINRPDNGSLIKSIRVYKL